MIAAAKLKTTVLFKKRPEFYWTPSMPLEAQEDPRSRIKQISFDQTLI